MAVVGPLQLVAALSDDELKERIKELSRRESRSTAALVAHLSEFEARKLYRAQACASTFTYCVQVLHLSEHAAYDRIAAARAVRRFPSLLDCLVDGSLHLSAISLICPLLTEANHLTVIDSARYRSKREIERLVATLRPMPSAADMIRRLPVARLLAVGPIPFGPPPSGTGDVVSPTNGGATSGVTLSAGRDGNTFPDTTSNTTWTTARSANGLDSVTPATEIARRHLVLPLAADRFRVQFTASAELHEKLRRAQAFLRHQIPDGDLARVFDRALTLLLEHVERRKLARRSGRRVGEGDGESDRQRDNQPRSPLAPTNGAGHGAPNPRSRHIPATVRRAVWHRDQGQCAFHDTLGRRCRERGHLEFHHVEPFARGGEATEENIQMRCRVHNQYESELVFGPDRRPDGAPVRT